MGRNDQQVKIRGFCTNLAEVERSIEQIEKVGRAVVLMQDGRVNAYVDTRKSAQQIRSYLRDRLPHYMVPDTISIVSKFPSLPNGKIDRRALGPTFGAAANFPSLAELRGCEEIVARFWSEALESSHVRRTDDFFEVGGDSLAAMDLLSKIEDYFGIELDIHDLIEFSSLAEFAHRVRTCLPDTDCGTTCDLDEPI